MNESIPSDPYESPRRAGKSLRASPLSPLQGQSVPAAPASGPVPSAAQCGNAPVPAIQVEGVSRSFGHVAAVRNLSFATSPGRVTALVGPNGCGKSTLMLMLAALLSPDAGHVRIYGQDPTEDAEAVHRLVGWMPDSFGAWDSLKVREVLEVIARAYFMDKASIRRRVDELLTLLDLASLSEMSAHVLSRGQKQRLGLARALVHSPRLLILDEPASGLDPASRRRLFSIVRDFAQAGGSVLISSHILSELEEMADDVIFMDSGALVQQVDLSTMAEQPRTWRLVSLERERLVEVLTELRVQFIVDPRNDGQGGSRGEVRVELPNEEAAVRLLADVAARGTKLVEFGPAAGKLESVYMSLEGARKEGAL